MTQLYSSLAGIYHEMYQNIFDYDKEFQFYDVLLKKHGCTSILEIGCGSGMLAQRFLQNGYQYLGLDLYDEMLDIAKKQTKSDNFIRCDMRNLTFDKQFDAVLITGRSLAYVTENKGIIETLKGIHQSLKTHGLLVFGVFEANGIYDNFNDFEQNFQLDNKRIRRISTLKMNLETGWTYDWHAKYIIEQEGNISEYDDLTTLRAFTKEEILLFLKLNRFKVEEIIEEPKTMTFITQKLG
ncbi:MAG: class I SAM-dependent DNA methyltransferase [Methylococcaceae bacterium]|nr:class I SAM-dependent methyltransferase [Prolixibacteraceae bacterium]